MTDLLAIVLILGGILALSGLIALKRPDLKPNLDALEPFKALIGIGLVILTIIALAQNFSALTDSFKMNQIYAAAIWSMFGAALLLGVLFGWPIIARAMPQNHPQAQQRIQELSANIAVFQLLIGAVGILAAIVFLLFDTHVLAMKDGILDKLPI